jgi:hypothetical protein
MDQPTIMFCQEGSATSGQNTFFTLNQALDNLAFFFSEKSFSVALKNFGNAHIGCALNFTIRIDKRCAQTRGNGFTDRCFARPHHADQRNRFI